jgi:hypothetical protein
MKVGMVVRRVWEKDGELWAERSETWDLEKYGASGTRRDIHIFDLDYGLQPGRYTLSLDIDGVPQEFSEGIGTGEQQTTTKAGFWIVKSDIQGPVTSPDKAYSIFVLWGGRISVEDPDGNFRDLIVTNEIASLTWFPDSFHLVYGDRDRTGQVSLDQDLGITHQLWILDIVTGERHRIGSPEENYHHPVISPDGHFIGVLSGPTFQEDCQASPELVFLELDEDFQKTATYPLSAFSGLPPAESAGAGVTPIDPARAGYWEDEIIFVASLQWICAENRNETDGIYLLNLQKKQAERLRE